MENNKRKINKVSAKRKKKKVLLKGVFRLLFLALCICIGSSFIGCSNQGEEVVKVISIPSGSSTKQIANILQKEMIINNALFFVTEAKSKGYDGKFKYGDYKLSSNMSTNEIMNELTKGGTVDEIKITIPEGYTIKQIAKKLEENGVVTSKEFLNACKEDYSYRFLKDVPASENYLEGYLFPATYNFTKSSNPREVVVKMLDAFDNVYDFEYEAKAKELGYSFHDVLTVASIIEREVKVPKERSMVAGVIYNRLKVGQALQMCSTIQYILGEQHEKLYESDLEIESPYNTYKYPGLPIGPISNPGENSILAALNPVVHNYYYFVLKDESTGEHCFSTTFDEHVNAKNKYIK